MKLYHWRTGNLSHKKAEEVRTATPCPIDSTRKSLTGKWKMCSNTVSFIKARLCQTDKIFDKVSNSWGKRKALKQICLDYVKYLVESFRENGLTWSSQVQVQLTHQVWRLLKGSQDSERGRLPGANLKARSLVLGLRYICVYCHRIRAS